MTDLTWDKGVQASFDALIEKTPKFLRGVAQEKVTKRIQALIASEGASVVTEKILVDAFFAETPFGFHGLLKKDMKEMNIEYTHYGHAE